MRTRLYFTSASHLYAFFNALLFGVDSTLLDKSADQAEVLEELKKINVLNYLSYIVIRLFEDLSLPSVLLVHITFNNRLILNDSDWSWL